MDMPDQIPKPRMSTRTRVLLAVSLGLNLLVIGIVVGASTNHGKWRHDGPRGAISGGPLTQALSPQDRRAIRRAIRAEQPEMVDARAARAAGMDAVLAEMRRVPFDPAALAGEIDASRAGMRAQIELGQAMLVKRLADMSDAERAAFADRIEEIRRHRRP